MFPTRTKLWLRPGPPLLFHRQHPTSQLPHVTYRAWAGQSQEPATPSWPPGWEAGAQAPGPSAGAGSEAEPAGTGAGARIRNASILSTSSPPPGRRRGPGHGRSSLLPGLPAAPPRQLPSKYKLNLLHCNQQGTATRTPAPPRSLPSGPGCSTPDPAGRRRMTAQALGPLPPTWEPGMELPAPTRPSPGCCGHLRGDEREDRGACSSGSNRGDTSPVPWGQRPLKQARGSWLCNPRPTCKASAASPWAALLQAPPHVSKLRSGRPPCIHSESPAATCRALSYLLNAQTSFLSLTVSLCPGIAEPLGPAPLATPAHQGVSKRRRRRRLPARVRP